MNTKTETTDIWKNLYDDAVQQLQHKAGLIGTVQGLAWGLEKGHLTKETFLERLNAALAKKEDV